MSRKKGEFKIKNDLVKVVNQTVNKLVLPLVELVFTVGTGASEDSLFFPVVPNL